MAIVWSDEYATEVGSIDRQHKKLFEYINKLEVCIQKGIFEGPQILDILNFLHTYVKVHFEHEEFCMKKRNCPVAGKNKKAHDDFIAFYEQFVNDYKLNTDPFYHRQQIKKLQTVAESWLVNHICKIDLSIKDLN